MRFLPVLVLPALFLLSVAPPASAQHITPSDCNVDVTVSAGPTLDVAYRCRSTRPITFVPDDETMAAHVQDLQDGAGAPVALSSEGWVVQPVNGLAEMHYRYDLADYARGVDTTSSAVLRGQGVLVSLSGWLLAPDGYRHFPGDRHSRPTRRRGAVLARPACPGSAALAAPWPAPPASATRATTRDRRVQPAGIHSARAGLAAPG